VSADLIDDEAGIAYTGQEAITNHMLVAWAINELKGRNGGAVPAVPWLEKSRRSAAGAKRELSRVRHDRATLLPDEPESAPNQKRIKIEKVAEILSVNVRTVYRWIKTDAALALTIIPSDSLWFDPELVEAYAKAHPRRRSAA
jgi:hypothetical protein